MTSVDYTSAATVSWTNPPSLGHIRDLPLEEYYDGFTLRDAVTFVMDHLEAQCRKSVIVRCGPEKYNEFDIEAIYYDLAREPLP